MIRILIVDDSPTDTLILKNLIESQSDMSVIACAKNGYEAIELVEVHKPDLITMDIQMPIMNGYDATKIIMERFPTPVVVISSYLSSGESGGDDATFNALESGALTALNKPKNINSDSFNQAAKHIIDTLRSMAEIKVIRRSCFLKPPTQLSKQKQLPDYKILVMGASVGGPHAIKTILARFPKDFPIPIVIVQHMTQGFIDGFVHWLSHQTSLKVKCAESNERLLPGIVYFAPDSYHLLIKDSMGTMHTCLEASEQISGFCPSISMLFKSIAKNHAKQTIAILLTGMGTDGAEGLLELKTKGAHTIIQNEASCVVFGMAAAAKQLGAVDKEMALDQIAGYLMKIINDQKMI